MTQDQREDLIPAATNGFPPAEPGALWGTRLPPTVIQKSLHLWESLQKPRSESTVIQILGLRKHTAEGLRSNSGKVEGLAPAAAAASPENR